MPALGIPPPASDQTDHIRPLAMRTRRVRCWPRGVAGGGGAVCGGRRPGSWWGRAPLLSSRRPPRRQERSARQVASHQPGPRCILRFIFRLGRGRRSAWRVLGRREAIIRGTGNTRSWSCHLFRGNRRQGFQNACTTPGGSVSYRGGAGVLFVAYHVLYIRQALLQTATQPQGEQKTVGLRGGRGDAVGGRESCWTSAVFPRKKTRRFLLRRVQPIKWRRGRKAATVPHQQSAADCFRTTGGLTNKTQVIFAYRTASSSPDKPDGVHGWACKANIRTSEANSWTSETNAWPNETNVWPDEANAWAGDGQKATTTYRVVRGRARRRARPQPRTTAITKQ